MKEIVDLLTEQNKAQTEQNKLNIEVMGEILSLLKLLAAESGVGNARGNMIYEMMEKILTEGTKIGDTSRKLLRELTS